MAYDAARDRVVLFGGAVYDAGSRPVSLQDVWEWDGARWTQACAEATCLGLPRPVPRVGASAVFDGAGVLVFGGGVATADGSPEFYQDLWRWDGAAWAELCVDAACRARRPTPRAGAALVRDGASGRILLFGGDGDVPEWDGWEWTGAAWVRRHDPVTASGPAPDRGAYAAAHDGARGVTVLWRDGVLWHWDGVRFVRPCGPTSFATTATLFAAGHAMAYDAARQTVVAYLGRGADGDPWEWDGRQWTGACAPGSPCAAVVPSQRVGASLAYWRLGDAAGEALAFGGNWALTTLRETWAWNGARWARLCTDATCVAASPPARAWAAMTGDAAGGVLLFGGTVPGDPGTSADDVYLGDTHVWSDGLWAPRCTTSPCRDRTPAARAWASLTWDTHHGRAVLFGGARDGGAAFGDTWVWTGGEWREACADGACRLLPRRDHGAAWEADRARVVVYGGRDPARGLFFDDVHEWDGTRWERVATRGASPGALAEHAMTYDAGRHAVLVQGGQLTDQLRGDTWELLNEPAARPGVVATFDWRSARAAAGTITGLSVHARAVGRGYTTDLDPADDGDVIGEPIAGVEMAVWDPRAGRWRTLSPRPPVPEDPDTLRYEAGTAEEARAWLLRDERLSIALAPAAGRGNGPDPGVIGVDFLEARVRYRASLADIPEVCEGGVDDDGNGLTDCADLPCAQVPPCVFRACPMAVLGSALGTPVAIGSTLSAGNDFAPPCVAFAYSDREYVWTAPQAGTYVFDTAGSSFNPVLLVLDGVCAGEALGCAWFDPTLLIGPTRLTLALAAGQTVTIVVDGYMFDMGPFALSITRQ
jgi:hypothetical protein